ncbi:MAG: glycosyltransferase family 2 protein [Flavobacteriales bacterium]
MIKVSVIITTYQSAPFIEQTLQCVFDQEGINEAFTLEVLVIDDGSTDDTQTICEKYDLQYFSNAQNSGGPNKGRNLGLQKATGQFICLCDHDDHWHRQKISIQLKYAEQAPIISGGYCVKNVLTKQHIYRGDALTQAQFFEQNQTFRTLLRRSFSGQVIYLSGIMYSAKLKHIEFEETYGFLDYDWFVRLFENQVSIQVPAVLFTRMVRDENLSLNENYRLRDYHIGLATLNHYSKSFPKECAIGKSKFNGTLARYYYLVGNMPNARKYLLKAGLTPKNLLFYLTSFVGHQLIKKYIHFFG